MFNCSYNRHIHLDFHTSEFIQEVGESFNAQEFASTLKEAKVNSITLFAKCHHGWCYYPTKTGKMHPNLKFDLLGEQIKACKKLNMRVLVYITGGWSVQDYNEHPEWQVLNSKQCPVFTVSGAPGDYIPKKSGPKPECSWPLLCLNGSYKETLLKTAEEVCSLYDIDGLFFDIMGLEIPCYCSECMEGMKKKGYNPENYGEVAKYLREQRIELFEKLRAVVKKYKKDGDIFFNSGGAEISQPYFQQAETYFELESLPSMNPLGIDSLINRGRFFARKEKKTYGMTGKFHTDWGEFGGYKHPNALRNECASLFSYPVACSIGEQLHPSGKIDKSAFRMIGSAYSYVQQLEPYIENMQGCSRLGVYVSLSDYQTVGELLSDAQFDFDIINEEEDLVEKYDCIILSDTNISKTLQEKLLVFLKSKKKLVAFGEICFDQELKEYLEIGKCVKSKYDVDYILCAQKYREKLLDSPILSYQSGYSLEYNVERYKSVATIVNPYFSRTEERYCSHKNTPYQHEPTTCSAVFYDRQFLYFSHEIPKIYFRTGAYYIRTLFKLFFADFYQPNVKINGLPCGGRYRILKNENNDYLLFLSYRSQFKRNVYMVEEDAPPIFGIQVAVSMDKQVEEIVLVPENKILPFEQKDGEISFNVDLRTIQYIRIKTK